MATATTAARKDKQQVRAEITYEVLSREDLPMLAGLINATRHDGGEEFSIRAHTAEYYDWMYFRNPAGPVVAFAGKHRGKLVTSFAMVPKRIQFGGERVLCGKTMDMFTLPEYQGLGLIAEAVSRVLEEASARGMRMWYVTPSDKSYPIFLNKWRYIESFRVNYIVRVLDYASVLGTTVRPAVLGKAGGGLLDLCGRLFPRVPSPDPAFEFRPERSFGPETDALWEKCRGYGVALVRDAAYLTWRYLDNPDRYDIVKAYAAGELRGILVTKLTRRRGLKVGEFVDCVAAPEDAEARKAMYRHGLKRFLSEGCAFAQNWAIEGSRWEDEMEECGISRRRRKMALLFSPGAPRPDLYDPQAWLLTPGDGNDL